MIVLTLDEWRAKGTALFGEKIENWKFCCPSCKEFQSLKEFNDNNIEGAREKFYFSCIGRYVKGRGCDWSLGGLLRIHSTEVISEQGEKVAVMEFAEEKVIEKAVAKTQLV